MIRSLVSSILQKNGYDVVTCENVRDAFSRLNNESIDCIVTDALMPGMDGFELTHALRNHPNYESLPILMLTKMRSGEDVKKAVESGVTDYVVKPIDEDLFLEKLDFCLKKNSGKRHVFELTVDQGIVDATLSFDCKIVSASESGIRVHLPVPVISESHLQIASRLLKENGLEDASIKLVSCTPIEESPCIAGQAFEAHFSFVGLTEPDLRKLRTWIQREAVRRKR